MPMLNPAADFLETPPDIPDKAWTPHCFQLASQGHAVSSWYQQCHLKYLNANLTAKLLPSTHMRMPPSPEPESVHSGDKKPQQHPVCYEFYGISRNEVLRGLGAHRIYLFILGITLGIALAFSTCIRGRQAVGLITTEWQISEGLPILDENSVAGASYDSQERLDPPRCMQNTCLPILNQLNNWVDQPILNTSLPVLWIRGSAGTGKSAIVQTIAEQWDKRGKLAASFFFRLNSPGLDEKTFAVVTIASQLARRVPGFTSRVSRIVESDPAIFSKSLQEQVEHLIALPLADISAAEPQFTLKTILLDGLDEISDPDDQEELLNLLATTVVGRHLPLRLIFTSRPDSHIQSIFNRPPLAELTSHLDLDTEDTNQDIETVLRSGFTDIKDAYPWLNDTLWPPPHAIPTLVQRSQGLFTYPSVLLKYLNMAGSNPRHTLEAVLKLEPNDAIPDPRHLHLNALYHHILSSLPPQKREVLIDIVAYWMSAPHSESQDTATGETSSPYTLDNLARLFLLDTTEFEWYLQDLDSIVTVPSKKPSFSTEAQVRPARRTFLDFLTDQSRSVDIYLDKECAHARTSFNYLKHLALKMSDGQPLSLDTWSLTEVEDAFRYHLAQAGPDADLRDGLLSVVRKDVRRYDEFVESSGLGELGLRWGRERNSTLFEVVSWKTRKGVVEYLQQCNESLGEDEDSWSKTFRGLGLQLYQFLIHLVFEKGILPEKMAGPFVTRMLV